MSVTVGRDIDMTYSCGATTYPKHQNRLSQFLNPTVKVSCEHHLPYLTLSTFWGVDFIVLPSF